MLKSSVSICAALILATAAFSAPAQAQRHGRGYVGSAHSGGVRVGSAGPASHRYAYRGGYGGRHYGGGWGYYGGGLAAGAIVGGLLAAAPYYGGGYYDGYGYDAYSYEAPVYVEPGPRYYYRGYRSGVSGANCGASPASPNFGACN